MIQLHTTTIREPLEFLHDVLQAALTVLSGFTLTEKIQIWTVENADVDHYRTFLIGGDKSAGKTSRCLPFGTVLGMIAAKSAHDC